MLYLAPKDKFSSMIAKNNLFTSIYIPLILYVLYLSGNLYKIGKYENLKIVLILVGLELAKYYFYRVGKLAVEPKSKKKSLKLEKLWKSISFILQMLTLFYIVSVLLGAPFLSKFEETLMLSCTLTVLAVLPVILYLDIEDVYQLLDLASQPPKDAINNMILIQFELTLLGAWLGAIPIPLDWDREWQVWPNSCILGTFGGYFVANVASYIIQSLDVFFRCKKNQKFKSML